MNERHAQMTWAGRIRNHIRSAFEYNKDCEVTYKFPSGKDRNDTFDLLKELKFRPKNCEEIITRPGQLVDFKLKKKNCALRLAGL